jgi:hypothetical protein
MIRGLWRSRPQSLAGVSTRPRRQWQAESWLSDVSVELRVQDCNGILLQLAVQKGGAPSDNWCKSSAPL